jgi:hypothetical protein
MPDIGVALAAATGATFGAVTVNAKLIVAVDWPSVTLTLIVAVPFSFGAGVMVTVRFPPLPPKMMFALGTNAVLDELALSAKFVTSVSASLIVKPIGSVDPP